MNTVQGMPYAVILENIGYYQVPSEFKYAIVTSSGFYVSDCIFINIRGEQCPRLEYPVPVNNENLSELNYYQLKEILSNGNLNFCRDWRHY